MNPNTGSEVRNQTQKEESIMKKSITTVIAIAALFVAHAVHAGVAKFPLMLP